MMWILVSTIPYSINLRKSSFLQRANMVYVFDDSLPYAFWIDVIFSFYNSKHVNIFRQKLFFCIPHVDSTLNGTLQCWLFSSGILFIYLRPTLFTMGFEFNLFSNKALYVHDVIPVETNEGSFSFIKQIFPKMFFVKNIAKYL